jgi:hypothetical protein
MRPPRKSGYRPRLCNVASLIYLPQTGGVDAYQSKRLGVVYISRSRVFADKTLPDILGQKGAHDPRLSFGFNLG